MTTNMQAVELKTASQTLCLGGIYVTNNVNNIERCKGQLIENKDHVLLASKHETERFEIAEFKSENSAKTFYSLLKNFGYSAAVHYHNLCPVSCENNPRTHLHRSAFCVVSLAKWTPNIRDISLSRSAIRFLKSIEIKLNQNDGDKRIAQDACLLFFKMFGTHIYMGTVTFGGIFATNAQATLHENENVESTEKYLKQIHNNAILDHIFVDIDGKRDQNSEIEWSENAQSREMIDVTKRLVGGPKDAHSYSEWKSHLLKNVDTWALIDSGEISLERCIGVWSLLRRNYKVFSNADKLSVFLAQTWVDHVTGGDVSNLVSGCDWGGLVKDIESTLQSNCSINCYLKSLKLLLQFLEKTEDLVGKPTITKVVDFASEDTIKKLFKESANQKDPVEKCFQILTTKLKILQLDDGKSPLLGESWMTSDNFFIQGLLSKRKFKDIEELLYALEKELLPGLNALEACSHINVKRVQILTNNEILDTVTIFFEDLLMKHGYQEALLLLIVFMPVGYHFQKKAILEDMSSNLLQTFLNLAKKEVYLSRKYGRGEKEVLEAWLLMKIIFKIDIDYRMFDASLVLADQLNDLVNLFKKKEFSFQANIQKVLYVRHTEESIHKTIQTLTKMCELKCVLFEDLGIKPSQAMKSPGTLENKSTELFHLIKIMGMEKYFPQNLSTDDILTLRDTMFNNPQKLKDLPWAILRRAIAIDYNFREKVLYDYTKAKDDQLSREHSQINAEKSKEEYFHPKKKIVSKKYHPMDIFLALWYCCDPFLKRLLANKIATCQLALPLIFEDITFKNQLVLSLWPIRDIFIDESPDSVVSKPLKTVSFFRVGNLNSISKSKIMNKFIRAQNEEHNTFYHRDCDLGSCKRTASNGLIEVSWYVPRKDDSIIKSNKDGACDELVETLCILNMRGDAREFRAQLSALLVLSDVVVVISEFQCLKEEQSLQVMKQVHTVSSSVIIMTDIPGREIMESVVEEEEEEEEEEEDEEERKEPKEVPDGEEEEEIHREKEENEVQNKEQDGQKKNYDSRNDGLSEEATGFLCFYEKITASSPARTAFLSTLEGGKPLNESELKERLTKYVFLALKDIKHPQSLEEKKMLLPDYLEIDENNMNSLCGSGLSEDILTDVENTIGIVLRKQSKDRVLPLQGESLWHKWCSEQKRCFRSGKKSVSENVCHEDRMKTLRIWQVLCCLQNQNTIIKFINIVESHINDKQIITYFLQWMKFHMDCQSRKTIPKLSNDLFEAFSQYETQRTQTEVDKRVVEDLKIRIKKSEENLARASFGLEHFFREMGQLYEAFMFCDTERLISLSSRTKHVIEKMPFIAAKLLHWGHPLEIMDGDAATVPESWIQAVLNEIRSIIGENKTLFVISVLGIQSSGKSTLLNTMFGLQFAVSAGRCTRGIYVQLIPVDKHRSNLKFDYALVIDTEGLRAPELAGEKFNHDNELATLVIGLADVALINIKGETIADMQDVLQIVVHALLRLKNANEDLNINQSCVFVHQNVSASNAGKSTFQGSQKITAILDEMTKHIAEEEKMANVMRFTDVIAFNPVKHIIHVPDLWKGIPPMAPASPEYSKKVVQVAKCVLSDICESKKMFLNSENTSLRLENLWKGILSEDFVFSFRNALEVKAFMSLEMKFQTLAWALEELKLQYLQKHLTQISCSKTPDVLQNNVTDITTSFTRNLQDITDKCDKELQDFFEKSDLSDYMIHWRDRKTKELISISNSIKAEIETKIQIEKGKCEALFASNRKLSSIKEKVIAKAVEIAKSVKNEERQMDKEEVKNKFELLWKEWLNELAPEVSENTIKKKIQEMETQIESDVRKKFSNHMAQFERISAGTKLPSEESLTVLTGCMKEEDLDEKDIDVFSIKEKIKRAFKKFLPERVMDYLRDYAYIKKTRNVLETIFKNIDRYFETQNKNIEYNSAQFHQVLNYVTDGFREHNDKSTVHDFVMTISLEMKTSLLVQKFASIQFKRHIREFEVNNSLRSKMARYQTDVESLFVGMYFQTANEELATVIICNHLERALKEKILGDLHIYICRVIIHSEFQNRKEPLIKAVLTDLGEKNEFSKYTSYIQNSKSYVRSWIEDYTIRLFTKRSEGNVSMLEKYVEQCLACACETVFETANKCVCIPSETRSGSEEIESNGDSEGAAESEKSKGWHGWIHSFRDALVKEHFPIPPDAFQALFILEVKEYNNLFVNIQNQMRVCSNTLLETLVKSSLSGLAREGKGPFDEIMKSLWRCEKVCPWCLEPCIMTSSEDKHACKQHRPGGVSGIRWHISDELVVESCEFDVQSTVGKICGSWCKCSPKSIVFHPCKEFKEYMNENWNISGSTDMSSSKYWNWVLKEFKDDFVKYYKAKHPKFPNSDTFKVTKEEAINSLSIYAPSQDNT